MQTQWGDCAVADAHIHFFSRPFFEALAGQTGKTADAIAETLGWELPPADPVELARRWVAELDVEGVEVAAVIASFPGDESSVLAAKGARPDRFLAYAMVNPVAENSPAIEGLDAICLFPAMHRYYIHDEGVQPLLEKAAEQRLLVFV